MTRTTVYPRSAPFLPLPSVSEARVPANALPARTTSLLSISWMVLRGTVMLIPIAVLLVFVLIGIIIDDQLPAKSDTE